MKNKDIKKVMVIDDTSSITEALGKWLKIGGVQDVVLFDNPLEAIEEIKKNGAPDFIVTDYNMPEMNGVEFLDKISQKHDINAVIMTAYPSEVKFSTKQVYEVIEKKLGFMQVIVQKINGN
ncbi:MAG: response regulator [Fibrobacter sp.]|nr:response regulator [Fibrobacter sp.]